MCVCVCVCVRSFLLAYLFLQVTRPPRSCCAHKDLKLSCVNCQGHPDCKTQTDKAILKWNSRFRFKKISFFSLPEKKTKKKPKTIPCAPVAQSGNDSLLVLGSHHGEALSGSRLSVGEDAGVVASEGVVEDVDAESVEDGLLTGEVTVRRIHGPEAVIERETLRVLSQRRVLLLLLLLLLLWLLLLWLLIRLVLRGVIAILLLLLLLSG